MLEYGDLNYLAIVVAWLVTVAVGWLWYSPMGFGKTWTKLSGVDIMKLPPKEANKTISAVIAASLAQTIVLAIMIRSVHIDTLDNGLLFGVFAWVGLAGPVTVGTSLYSRRGWKFWWLNSSYSLVVLILSGGILATWR